LRTMTQNDRIAHCHFNAQPWDNKIISLIYYYYSEV
jgi:hypothetical protein